MNAFRSKVKEQISEVPDLIETSLMMLIILANLRYQPADIEMQFRSTFNLNVHPQIFLYSLRDLT